MGKFERAADTAMTQFAAICYRTTPKKGCEVLLITSRDTGRWVIPKGWPMKGKTGAECALQEAFEEAGVEGRPDPGPIGIYSYDKVLGDGALQPCVVSVFPVAVARLKNNFPERAERDRRWFTPQKAAQKVAEPELQALLAGFAPASGARGTGGTS